MNHVQYRVMCIFMGHPIQFMKILGICLVYFQKKISCALYLCWLISTIIIFYFTLYFFCTWFLISYKEWHPRVFCKSLVTYTQFTNGEEGGHTSLTGASLSRMTASCASISGPNSVSSKSPEFPTTAHVANCRGLKGGLAGKTSRSSSSHRLLLWHFSQPLEEFNSNFYKLNVKSLYYMACYETSLHLFNPKP